MTFPRKSIVFIGSLIFLLCAANLSLGVEIPGRPEKYVVDLAGVLDDGTEMKINGLLQELEQKTTAQFIILTIPSLEGESLEETSITIAHDKWKLGQKGKDNGVLLLIAIKDRKYRFEVGYGLEGVLPDSYVGSVGRQILVPYFKKDDFTGGIYASAAAIAQAVAKDAAVELTGLPKIKEIPGRGRPGRESGPLGTLFSLVMLLIFGFLFIRHPRALLLLWLFSGLGGGRHWGGGYNRGGFGGGGGGGFGGGGASGGW
ncbi:MAG TPA: TPM domain-containing protein [Deltaproteobacteria bacterium]|nr:TPM domain-containing protein [Deltaproteobacteria bacterium]